MARVLVPSKAGEDVTFPQLRAFACAARATSFAHAAELLEISQPAVSEHIKTLEQRLGRRLFQRRRGTTSILTADGEEARDAIDAILLAHDALFKHERQSPEKIVLRISAGPYVREKYLQPLVARICKEHPEVEIDFQPTGGATKLAQLMTSGALDLAIYALSAEEAVPPGHQLIAELPLVMIGPPGTRARLAAGTCTIEEFQFIFPSRRDAGARWARKCLRDLGIKPRRALYFSEFAEAAAQMVEDGQGIGHLMLHAVSDRVAAGRVEVLDIPLLPMRRYIARSAHAPAVARNIEQTLLEALST